MKRLSGLQEKKGMKHRRVLHCAFLAGWLIGGLSLALWSGVAFAPLVFAAPRVPSQNVFTVSPTQGPVNAVISVSATGVTLANGTQVSLGYTANLQTCTVVTGGPSVVVQNSAFSGWFRWPSTTGVGSFGVCAMANNAPFQIGSYQVLSASAPHISLTPAPLSAGEQAKVSGTNFLPGGTSVNLVWRQAKGGKSLALGTVTADTTGAFTYTFTVPAHASTGSYTVGATVGSGSPPALSATTTFHVNGVTIVAVPTPTTAPVATATPTLAPTVAPTATTPRLVSSQPQTTDTGNLANKASLLMPIAVGAGVLILLALVVGVVIVRRQRKLLTASAATSSALLWPENADTMMLAGPQVNSGAEMFAPPSGTIYPSAGVPPISSGTAIASPVPEATWKGIQVPSFDPGLAEAMREAQVSLFATPRPPVGEEVEIQ